MGTAMSRHSTPTPSGAMRAMQAGNSMARRRAPAGTITFTIAYANDLAGSRAPVSIHAPLMLALHSRPSTPDRAKVRFGRRWLSVERPADAEVAGR